MSDDDLSLIFRGMVDLVGRFDLKYVEASLPDGNSMVVRAGTEAELERLETEDPFDSSRDALTLLLNAAQSEVHTVQYGHGRYEVIYAPADPEDPDAGHIDATVKILGTGGLLLEHSSPRVPR